MFLFDTEVTYVISFALQSKYFVFLAKLKWCAIDTNQIEYQIFTLRE